MAFAVNSRVQWIESPAELDALVAVVLYHARYEHFGRSLSVERVFRKTSGIWWEGGDVLSLKNWKDGRNNG